MHRASFPLEGEGRRNPPATSRCGSLLPSASADPRSSDDVIAFEGLINGSDVIAANIVLSADGTPFSGRRYTLLEGQFGSKVLVFGA